jgi:small subunit ribosomal protein S6
VRSRTSQKEVETMNRSYEIMFIVRPDLEEADVDKQIESITGTITNGGGEVKSVEKMGRRRLAYTVRKFNDGIYVLLIVSADGGLISEIERRLRVTEQVIKFLTVRTDEEEKRVNKIKSYRATHVKRSAQPVAAPVEPEAPQAQSVETPSTPPPEAAATEPAPTAEPTPAAEPVPAAV